MVSTRRTPIPEPARTMTEGHLWSYGILEVLEPPHLLPCNLHNPIHPLFHVRNWRGISAPLYHALAPALRLATLFITSRHFAAWWVTAALGSKTTDPTTGRTVLTPIENTQVYRKQTTAVLAELAQYVHFGWADLEGCSAQTWVEAPASEAVFGNRGPAFAMAEHGETAHVQLSGE